jgi:DNA-binding transcriptional LysR family regulator
MAELLGVSQAEVSKMERRTELYVGTLRKFIEAMNGELVIAANEATCIYVLPRVFSEYRQLFPAVQLQVNRSYGSRVVEAVLDNSADFGLTQLPVEEKRVQVVNVLRNEQELIRALCKSCDCFMRGVRSRIADALPPLAIPIPN